MAYLSLKRDSFDVWVDSVNIQSYRYEFSNRTYFISGEFYALADKNEIKVIKDLHGDRWADFYPKYSDVKAFISDDGPKQQVYQEYKPESADVADFINGLKNEKS